MLEIDLIRKEFSDLKDSIFLNVSSVVIPPKSVQVAYTGYMQKYVDSLGATVVSDSWDMVNNSRKDVAELINSYPKEIAFVKNTAEGIGIIANGYPFEPGDNIIVPDLEHSSNLFSWIKLQDKEVELRTVPSRHGNFTNIDIYSLMDSRTKAVAISAVQFTTGFYTDLFKLGEHCRKHNVLLIVDAIQAIGRLHLDVRKMNISYLACGGNKGLLATLGVGFVYCSQDIITKIIPPYASYQSVKNAVKPPAITTDFSKVDWHDDARRLESGNLNYAGISAIQAGVRLINKVKIQRIEPYVINLEKILRERTNHLPLKIWTPENERNYSGIVCIYYPIEKEETVISILESYQIYATMRGGYIRLGIHFYNTKEQMYAVAEALEEISNLIR